MIQGLLFWLERNGRSLLIFLIFLLIFSPVLYFALCDFVALNQAQGIGR